ncbi:MAG: hypothetical protein ACREBB_11390 [Nitrosotalea sp.]
MYRNLQQQTNGIISGNEMQFSSNLPFWCGHYRDQQDKTRIIQDGEKCCYNHWLGLPKRWDKRHPMYEYEINFVQFLSKYRKLHVEKAAGLGITELVLRWLEWMALTNPEFQNSQVEIVSGPNRVLAKELISRMVGLKEENEDYHDLGSRNVARDITDYSFRIGTTTFEAVPSDNIDAIRGKPNCKAIFVDEAAFFLMKASNEIQIRQAAEHYDLKSNPWIIWVSTPGFIPEGVFHQIKIEEPSQYKKIQLNYLVGLDANIESMTSMYHREALEEAKKSPSFPREYMLIWGGGQGNIFHWKLIDEITETYDLKLGTGPKGLYIDPAFGTSKFAILGLELIDSTIYVKEALQFDRPSPAAMLDMILQKAPLYNNRVLVDAAHPGLIKDLQLRSVSAREVAFNKELSTMTIKASQAVKDKRVRIHPAFHDLISQLKAVDFNEKGHPDKKKLTFDLGDAFLMGVDDLLKFGTGHFGGAAYGNSDHSFPRNGYHIKRFDDDIGYTGDLF